MIRRIIEIVAITLLCSVAHGQIVNSNTPPDQKPTTRTLDCTNGGCHAKQIDHKFLHGPTAVKACEACHQYVDPAAHTFEFKRQGRDLCEFCHIDKSGREGAFVHKPVQTGDCAGCHDPHGSSTRVMLRSESTPQLCLSCHKAVMDGKFKHGPAAADCTACHKSHTSSHPHLLSMEVKDLCVSCHEDIGKAAKNSKHPHPPATGDCLKCHSAHATDQHGVLLQPLQALCASCHQKTVESASHAKHTHGALSDARACMNCHVPHGSEYDKQLATDPIASCLQCHDKPIQVSPDRVVAGVPEIADPTLHKHGAIAKGDCSVCHTVHGGELDRLLIANYNNTFYQKYSDQAYELCFKCHSKEIVMGNTGDPQTRFRDGGRNLHAMHVASNPNGRNCRSCHSIHASKYTQLINDHVPFGAWQLPINFKPSENGGSCAPGCHEPQTYDRAKQGTSARTTQRSLGPGTTPPIPTPSPTATGSAPSDPPPAPQSTPDKKPSQK